MKIWKQIFNVFMMIGVAVLGLFLVSNVEPEEVAIAEIDIPSVYQMSIVPVQTPPPKVEEQPKYESKHLVESSTMSLNRELQSDVTYKSVERASSQEDSPQISSTTGASLAYFLQVASFSSFQSAYDAAENLQMTYPDIVYVGEVDGKYRVLIGRFNSRWETKLFRRESNFPKNCHPVHEKTMTDLRRLV